MHGSTGAHTHAVEKRNGAGTATYFHVGMGACGKRNKDTDLILALSGNKSVWARGANCGRYVQIRNKKNGKTAYGLVRDECPDCKSGDLDLSPALFKKLGNMNDGELPVTWTVMAKGFKPPA